MIWRSHFSSLNNASGRLASSLGIGRPRTASIGARMASTSHPTNMMCHRHGSFYASWVMQSKKSLRKQRLFPPKKWALCSNLPKQYLSHSLFSNDFMPLTYMKTLVSFLILNIITHSKTWLDGMPYDAALIEEQLQSMPIGAVDLLLEHVGVNKESVECGWVDLKPDTIVGCPLDRLVVAKVDVFHFNFLYVHSPVR